MYFPLFFAEATGVANSAEATGVANSAEVANPAEGVDPVAPPATEDLEPGAPAVHTAESTNEGGSSGSKAAPSRRRASTKQPAVTVPKSWS